MSVPVLPGFHPDPSIVRTDAGYFLVTSTFEYLPGIPVFHSDDLESWTLIGHVAARPGQLAVEEVPTMGGCWAPTIRFRDGTYYLIVTDAMGRGNLVFTATDPAGPWSDGLPINIEGIDPDLAWDEDGTCYVTFSGLVLSGGESGKHFGIQQVRVDLATGKVLEEPRSLWSGTGNMFPEAPHIYHIGERWYLMVAEGGTERGHSITIARSDSPEGPFESCPHNPLITARGTARPVQCTGHGDLFQAADGRWHIVMLGTWTGGMTNAFSPLGRETYITSATWEDDWPLVEIVGATERTPLPRFHDDFSSDVLGMEWIGVRRFPDTAGRLASGALLIEGEGRSMGHSAPTFVGRRPTRVYGRIAATVKAGSDGTVGGLSLRYDERTHYDLELQPSRVVARAVLPSIEQTHEIALPQDTGPIELAFEMRQPVSGPEMGSCDLIDLVVITNAGRQVITTLDGRYLSNESATSFTGRVVGVYCQTGQLQVTSFEETGPA